MSKYIPGNQKHLTLNGRIYIENELAKGTSFKDIAAFLCKDPTTISKEVRAHRISDWYHKGTLGTYGHLYPNTNLEVAKKLTGILQVQSATESIANYTSNQHTAIYHRTVEENNAMKMQSYKGKAVKPL